MKKIISLLVLISMIFSSAVYAAEYDAESLINKHLSDSVDMDRVYKYDYYEKDEQDDTSQETGSKELQFPNAVNTMLALEIMSLDDSGTFNEDEFVSYREFAETIMRLSVGSIDELSEQYKNYPASRFATQHEAAYYLVGVLGYGVYDNRYGTSNPRSYCAQQIKLLNGIKFAGDKNITRGEFAQMIYNSLMIDMVEQTAYRTDGKFEISKGTNLLSGRFNAEIVQGMVTAQNGFDLYSNASGDENQIKISNATYSIRNLELTQNYLGYRVFAIAKESDNDDIYELIAISVDENNGSFSVCSADITEYSTSSISYIADGKEEKVSIGSANRVLVNGASKSVSQFVDMLRNGAEGDIRFCREKSNGNVEAIVFYNYETFKVAGVSTLNEKINLADGRTYKDNSYIDYAEIDNLYVEKDGNRIDITNISAGQIISVAENTHGTALYIAVSDKAVSGKITAQEENRVCIENVWYNISGAYEEARNSNPAIPELVLGSTRTVLLDSCNQIAAFRSGEDAYLYGFMTKAANIDSGLESDVQIRVFTMDNTWEIYSLADTLTLDGANKIDKKAAFDKMQSYQDQAYNALIRYKLSSNKKVTFLDTSYIATAESGDDQSLRKGPLWEDKHNWTTSAEMTSLSNSKYIVDGQANVFTIPDDLTKEDQFSFGKPQFRSETKGKLQLYNLDDYFISDLVINMSGAPKANFEYLYSWAIVYGKYFYTDENGQMQEGLKVFDGSTTPYWKERKITINSRIKDEASKIEVGDIILMDVQGTELQSYQTTYKASNLLVDSYTNLGGEHSTVIGNVISIDVERNLVKVKSGTEEIVYYVHSLGVCELDTKNCYEISSSDIQPGDRIFCAGGSMYMRMLILR